MRLTTIFYRQTRSIPFKNAICHPESCQGKLRQGSAAIKVILQGVYLEKPRAQNGKIRLLKCPRCRLALRILFMLMGSLGFIHSAYAIDFSNVNPGNLNAATFIANFGKTIPHLMQLVTAIAYVMGMFFVVNGLFHLKKYGEQRSQASSEAHLKGPIIYLLVGAALLYLPTTVRVGMATFWVNPFPYQYDTDQSGAWASLLKASFMIIQLIGIISFIRGLVLLTHLGGAGGQQQGTLGKALAHIIAGILCIDMYDFLQTVFNTLALGR